MDDKSILSLYLITLIKRKKLIITSFFLVSIIAFVYAFFIREKMYRSQVTFLPPIEKSGLPSVISGVNLDLGKEPSIKPHQIKDIFNGKILRKKIIDRFDLISKYKLQKNPNKFEEAIKELKKKLTMEFEETGSIGFLYICSFTISALHTSPDTCYQMAKYSYFLLDSTIKELSMNSAKMERIYIETRLKEKKVELDSLQKRFRNFQLKNKAFDIPEQVAMALENYAFIRSEILANDIKIKSLETSFHSNFHQIEEIKELNRVLKNKLYYLEKKKNADVLTGLEISSELLPIYSQHIIDIETQSKLIVFLKQQLEQAKLKEARDISSLHLIDPPFIPEYKFKPKRLFIMAIIIVPFIFFLIAFIILQEYYLLHIKNTETFSRIVDAFTNKKR